MGWSDKEIRAQVVNSALEKAKETIPFFELPADESDVVLYGQAGAVLDSLNLITFVFLLEEIFTEKLGLPLKITTEDVLNEKTNPFASLDRLTEFLRSKANAMREGEA